MLSILLFSGKHWSRAALAWVAFASCVGALADAGAESAKSRIAAHNDAVALGVLAASERVKPAGAQQVAKIEISQLDLSTLHPAEFGDADAADPKH